jgi:hypothetical protein
MTAKKSNAVATLHPAGAEMQSVHPGTMIQALLKVKDIDIKQLEGLFELQIKYDQEIARKAFHSAKSRFASMAKTIMHDEEADFEVAGRQTKYGYATLAASLDQIRTGLTECGLHVGWKTDDSGEGGNVRVTCFLTHELGHQEETSLSASREAGKGSTGMNSLQAVKSTVSYLERITLYALLGLASKGDDDDGQGAGQGPAPVISNQQLKSITTKIAKVGAETPKLLALFEVKTLADLTIDQYQPFHALLAAKAAADKNKAATK